MRTINITMTEEDFEELTPLVDFGAPHSTLEEGSPLATWILQEITNREEVIARIRRRERFNAGLPH